MRTTTFNLSRPGAGITGTPAKHQAMATTSGGSQGRWINRKQEPPSLVSVCLECIAHNFTLYPDLPGIPQKFIDKICAQVPVSMPVEVAAIHISDDSYWKRAAMGRWRTCQLEEHGGTWKQMYLERHVEELLESFPPNGNVSQLKKQIQACRLHIFSLKINQLLSHIDMGIVFDVCPFITRIQVTFGAKHVGMDYERSLFGMKMSDAQCLVRCIKMSQRLVWLGLPCNLIDDDLMRMLIAGMQQNYSITQLDLSHNKIGDHGARRVAKLLGPKSLLTHVNLADNQIHADGARYLGQMLRINDTLLELNLRLNRIGDSGGKSLCEDLIHNSTLTSLHIGSNSLGYETARAVQELLNASSILTRLDVSCNNLQDNGGKLVRDAVRSSHSLVFLDVRMCQLPPDLEEEINQIVKARELHQRNIPMAPARRRRVHQDANNTQKMAANSLDNNGSGAFAMNLAEKLGSMRDAPPALLSPSSMPDGGVSLSSPTAPTASAAQAAAAVAASSAAPNTGGHSTPVPQAGSPTEDVDRDDSAVAES